MKIEELVKDVKAWIALGVILLTTAGVITAYANMPKKIEAIEVKVAEQDKALDATKDNVEKLAGSIDKYVTVQAEQQKAQEMREQLMLKLIEMKKDR